jgi:predicted GNAT family acetyltransferase
VVPPDPVSPILVVDDEQRGRLLAEVDGTEAYLAYRLHGDRLTLVHTEVPEAAEGRGVGGALVRAALERARRDGLVLEPWCPFARRWLSTHKDERGDVTIDWTSRPPRSPLTA